MRAAVPHMAAALCGTLATMAAATGDCLIHNHVILRNAHYLEHPVQSVGCYIIWIETWMLR